MPIQTKDINAIAGKWSQRAQAAGADYTAGVKSPRKDWAQNTAAAGDSWGQGVQTAVADGRFVKGVTRVGTPKWQANSIAKGSVRYPQGVAVGQPAFQAGFGPALQVIQGLNLPPRSPRGSPSNNLRTTAVNDALHRFKVGA